MKYLIKKIKKMKPVIINRDIDISGSMSSGKVSDRLESQDLLLDIMMKKYDITNSDLDNISIVKSKIRDINIEEILK